MSERKPPPRNAQRDADDPVMQRIDRALARWPEIERGADAWDDAAEKVVSRIESGAPLTVSGISDEDLLRSPLPASLLEIERAGALETGKPEGRSGAARLRDGASLRDAAKLANRAAPADDDGQGTEDSGVIVLAELMASGRTAQAAEAAQAAQATSAGAKADGSHTVDATRKRGGTQAWIALSGAIVGAAIAAGVFFGLQRGATTGAGAVAPSVGTSTGAGPVAAVTSVARPAVPETPTPTEGTVLDPSRLPMVASGNARGTASVSGPASGVTAFHAVAPGRPGGAPSKPAASGGTPAESAIAATPATSSATGLGDLMRQAAGVAPSSAAAGGATGSPSSDGDPGSVPRKPSLGAIQGAIGMVLPAARVCLGPDDPISHATVTFKSDGSVESVSISGGALGKPAEACIRAALMRAHVPPFAQPIFTAPATVRPD